MHHDKNHQITESEKTVSKDTERKMYYASTVETDLIDKDNYLKAVASIGQEGKSMSNLETSIEIEQDVNAKNKKNLKEPDLQNKNGDTEEAGEEDEIADQLMDFLNVDRKRSRRSTTTDSGLGDDDYRDSSPESDDLDGDLKDGDGKRRSNKDGHKHKKKGYRPSSRQISKEDDKPEEPSSMDKKVLKDADKPKKEPVQEQDEKENKHLQDDYKSLNIKGKTESDGKAGEVNDIQNQKEKDDDSFTEKASTAKKDKGLKELAGVKDDREKNKKSLLENEKKIDVKATTEIEEKTDKVYYIQNQEEKVDDSLTDNSSTTKKDNTKKEPVHVKDDGDKNKKSLQDNEQKTNTETDGKADKIYDSQNQREKVDDSLIENASTAKKDKQQKKMAVPKIMIDEIDSLDEEEEDNLQREDMGRDSKTSHGVEDAPKGTPELAHESTVQFKEYVSVNANDEECFVDEFSVVMSADTNQEYTRDLKAKAESEVESPDVSKNSWSLKTESDLHESMENEQMTLTPNIEVQTDSQMLNEEPENSHVTHDDDASSEASTRVQLEGIVVKDDEIENNNDSNLVSANALKKARQSTPDESDANSKPKIKDRDEQAKKKEEELDDSKQEKAKRKEETPDISIKLNMMSFDSGIDNESIVSEQSTAVSETPLSTSAESAQNRQDEVQKDNNKEPINEEYLQNLRNEKKQLNLKTEETEIRDDNVDDKIHIENEKNERKATLRKQHMVIESDEDEDDTRSRSLSIHDDDYFASTESLGMGMSRESLAFSQLDLFCAETIPEKDENVSRSSSKDDEAMEEDDFVDHELKQQAILDALKQSEYSEDIDSSELLSSDPEDYGMKLAKHAREISEEMSSINQAWSETTSYTEYTESSFWTTDVDGISMDGVPTMEPVSANQINDTQAVRDVSVVDKKQDNVKEVEAKKTDAPSILKSEGQMKISAEGTEGNSSISEDKQPLANEPFDKKEADDSYRKPGKVEKIPSVEDDDKGRKETDLTQKRPSKGNESSNSNDQDLHISGSIPTIEDKIEGKKADISEREHPCHQISSDIKQSVEPVEETPLKMEAIANVESKPKDTSDELALDVTTDISSKQKPLSPPRILRATSDVRIENGESIVLEWKISGNPVPDIKMFKDGKPVNFCDGENIFKEDEYVAMEILDATSKDSGCYEIHLTNSLGTDIGMINVMVKDSRSSSPKGGALEQKEKESLTEMFAYPPEFSVAPSDCVIQEGRTVIIKGCVKGNPPPRVQWFRGERQISGDGDLDIIDEGSYSCLVIPCPTAEHAGKYSCQAINDLGVAETHFNLIYKGQDLHVQADEEEEKQVNKTKRAKLQRQECVPSAPNVQLEISESQGIMPQKFSLLKDYVDKGNATEVHKGEVVEVLDKIDGDHWLVRTGQAGNEICYVAPSILEPFDEKTVERPSGFDGTGRKSNRVDDEMVKKIKDKQKSLIQDVVDTETDYVCDLKDLIDNYIQPIRKEDFPQTLKANENDIFANLLQIYKFHHKVLLPELTECSGEPDEVANVFLKKRESFSNYLPYLATRRKASEVLYDKEVQDFLKSYSQSIGDSSNALEELLSRPVERVHEYIELLKNLIKYTVASGGDCTELIAAVQMLTDICRQVDQIMLLQNLQGYHGDTEKLGPILRHEKVLLDKDTVEQEEEAALHHVFVFGENVLIAKETGEMSESDLPTLQFDQILPLKDVDFFGGNEDSCLELWDCSKDGAKKKKDLEVSPVLTLQVQNPRAKEALVREIQEAQNKLGIKRDRTKMPEHRKLNTKTQKVKTSTPRKKADTKGPLDNESDRSSDDFNLINVDNYLTPEFEDGTTRPMFRKKLQKTIVSENSTARLQCTVVGIPHPKVLWLKNNRPLKNSDRCRVISDGDLHILEFAQTKLDDSGLYTARAMNVNGSTISTAELLVGNVQPSSLKKYHEGMDDSEYQTPAYFFQMNNCQVEEGRLARFDCRVVAYPKPDITWMKDGKVVEPDNRYKLLNFNDEIYSLLIQDVEVTDTGRYTCWAHNKYGEAMTEAYLNVIALEEQLDDTDIAPKFLTKFYDQTVNEGVPTEFQCMIAGKPKPAVRWLLDEIEIKPTENIKIMYEDNLCSLKIDDAKIKDSGNYTCHIKNTLGEASCTAGLTVLDDKVKGVPMLPKFLKRIGDVTAHGGDEIIYEVVVVGEPRPKVSWLYNHKPISETHRRFRMSHDGDIYRLHMSELCTTDEGKVTCKAVNSEGEVYCSSNLTVKRPVQEVSDKPATSIYNITQTTCILLHSFKQKDFDAKYGCPPTFMKRIDDMYSPEGKAAKFECKVMGIPEPVVTWVKDGKPLAPGSKYWINRDGGHCSLTVRDVSLSDVGIYTCSVANAAGEVSCVANLKIESVPTLPYDKPSLSDIREESVRLSWLPAYTSNLPQDARNVKYMVEARELPGFEWNKVATGIHGNTHLVKGLRPQSEYAFRIRAENQHGSSDATQPCMLTREKPVEEDFMQKLSLKMPDFKQPPKLPPSKPVVTDIGEETVRLAWKPAVVPPTTKKATPISYRLEAQELPSSDWMPLASRLRDTSYYLPELQKDRDYNIRVRAETKYGLSEPTEPLWIPRASVFPGVPIKRPEITDIEPTMARVSWARVEVPTFSRDEEPLLYMLEMQAPPARDWQEVARDIPSTSHIVTDLKPGQDYRFRVKARTPLGVYSEPSPLTSMYRTLATTRVPIDRFELEDSEPDFEGVRLAWNRVNIPPYHSDEEPLLYMVEINEPPIDEWRPLVSGLPTTRYRVTDLTPDRDYKFRVRAVTPYGVSPPSYTLPVSYRRPSTAHIPTRAMSEIPQLLYDDTDALKLTWRAPSVDTKRPIKYQVQMQTPQSMSWKPLASGIPDTSYRIRGLGPSRDYTFRVVPETSIGALEPLPPVSLTSLPAPKAMLQRRPEIRDLEPESLTLSWERPLIDLGYPVSYRVDMQEPPSLDWRPIATGIPDTKYRVTGLRPSRDYHFKVTPVTSIGDLEPLPHVTLTSMPVRPRLYPAEPIATEVGKDSIKLSWQPAEMPFFARHKLPVRYSIDMRNLPNSEWIPVTRSILDTMYVVKGLRSDQDYQFRIKAHTDSGSSDPSLPVTVYRRPVPIFPRREPVITSLGPDSIVLTWQPADIPGNQAHMPNVTYRIEVQDPPEIGQWRPLISNLSRTTYHVTGLRPDQDYLFRIRAQTDKVVTEPTMPVYLSRRAGPPRMPREEPFIFEVHPESVKLQWRSVELPSRITDYSPVTYRLEMQELPRSDWTTLARGIPHTDFHVTNLHPDKEYNFRIRAENEMGIGEPTPSVTLKKRSVPPSLPQEEPLIYDVSPNGAFRLSWRPADVSSGFLDGSPITYTIYVQEPPSGSWRPLVRRIPHTSYHVTSLHPDRDYSFRIQAENEFGVSRPTLPVRLIRRTEWKAPIETPEIYDIDETSRSLRLQWRPRAISPFDKTPMKYHVESWEPRARTWRPLASGIPDTSYRVTSLPFDQDYLFRVRAEAASALSEPTYPVSLSRFRLPSRMPIYRPQLYDVEPESVRLSWQPVHLPGREPIRLPSRYQLELRELHARDWRPVAHDIPDTHYRVTGLRPQQDYEFRVRGVADDGPTDYTTPIQLYRRTTIPHLPLEGPRISHADEDYVDLNWRLIDIPATSYNEQPLAFLIEAQRPPQYNWTPVARNVTGDHYRVTGLQRHQDYVFRIRAEYPSGLSEPSPVIPVYRRPSESVSMSYIPSRGRSIYSDYFVAPQNISHRAQAVDSRRENATTVGSVTNMSTKPSAIKSKTEYFLAEMKRIARKDQDISKQISKYRLSSLKPSQSATSLKSKFVEEAQKVTTKPPPSPRSRRDKFLAEKKLATTKVPQMEKKADFSKALEKFRQFAETRPFRPPVYQRDYSRERTPSYEPNLPRKFSLDSRKPAQFSTINPSLKTTYDLKPAPKLSSSASTRQFLSLAADNSMLDRRRSMSFTNSDLSFKKRHLVPDRLKYGQITSVPSSYGQTTSVPSTYRSYSNYDRSSSRTYESISTKYDRKPLRTAAPYTRPHSWSGRDKESSPRYTTKSYETNRSTSTYDVRSGDYRSPSSLSRIGMSVYHDLYSQSGSRVRGGSYSQRGYDDYSLTRSTRSMSRSDISMSRTNLSRASVPRSFAPLSKQPSMPNLGVSESISDIMNRYLKSGSSRSRERTPPISSRRFDRRGSFSSDAFTMKSRSDSISYPSFSRSPSFSTRRSPSMAKTLLDLSGMSRSASIAESGYLSIKSRTPSLPQNMYDTKTRSQSVAQGEYDKYRSGSVSDTGKVFPKPRSSSAIITGLPPIYKAPGSPSSKRKDVSVSYTSYVPKTKQSMAKKLSGSRDSLLSGDSYPGRSGSPSNIKAGTPRREATPSSIKKEKLKGLDSVREQKSVGALAPVVVDTKEDTAPTSEIERPSWLRTPTMQSQKHLA
ncbi:hypothetical protein FSP39_019350 [Pinctada imbricata]|uniref:Obscurin n=1 Tax=Pinctada imbricata TaxID=66713 RepID=A0AA88XDK4_PINIB|nr:hypothetical protein FSP39_019350 [Pinctada imbricata]